MDAFQHTRDDLWKGEKSGMEIFVKLQYSKTAMYTEAFRKPWTSPGKIHAQKFLRKNFKLSPWANTYTKKISVEVSKHREKQ